MPRSEVEDICAQIVALQRDRVNCIRAQSGHDRRVEAHIRNRLGFDTGLPPAERKRLSAAARHIRTTVERGGDGPPSSAPAGLQPIAAACSPVILTSAQGRALWDRMRADIEAAMMRLAQRLPAGDFIRGVKGVTFKTLAVIVGEAGNLSNYPDRSRLQKRLSIGCIDGVRQGNPGLGATAEDWLRHGYKRSRRAEIWALLDDVMLRAQWRGPKGDEPGHAIGPYGERYARKKAEYLVRFGNNKGGAAHADKAARRYMAKKFIEDLWRAWRTASFG